MDVVRNPMPIGAMPVIPAMPLPVQLQDLPVLTMEPLDINSLPEMERFTVNLTKDIYGLGITIAGYVCEKGNARPTYVGYFYSECFRYFERIPKVYIYIMCTYIERTRSFRKKIIAQCRR